MKQKQLTAKQEFELKRQQVMDLELQARYWKANYDLKYYYLEDQKIDAEYKETAAKELAEMAAKRELQIREMPVEPELDETEPEVENQSN